MSEDEMVKMTVRLDEDLYSHLQDRAEAEGLSVSAHVRIVLGRLAKHERARDRVLTVPDI